MAVKLTEFTDDLPQTEDFLSIVLNNTPLIDVRAPIEFSQGAFETATNLPLMSDEERDKVGKCYKQHGNEAAVKLGHQLVSDSVRAPRVAEWSHFMDQHPEALLYCFRGGMRSKISQQWLQDAGRTIVRLKGGYKAFRRYLIDALENVPQTLADHSITPIVLAGRTGAGKTLVIHQIENSIDLEGLAHHRGSAFGRHATPQPTQINFENSLSMAFIRFFQSEAAYLLIEDEGRNIGSVDMAKGLFDGLKSGPRVVVDSSVEERTQITLDEYVTAAQQEYAAVEDWVEFMLAAFGRIKKRLGGERYQRVLELFDTAMIQQQKTGSQAAHKAWIHILLVEYYDPMYDYQMSKSDHPVLFKGSIDEVVAFLKGYEP
ncbi:MAG: tRNA 2-selenouridine(34) synthase MnmH [Gammaproteobacteria bacterium]|nr:tRNA 2-selenouridine(34) synthase MnmH [Gammaproteobacteria bacterium]